MSILVKGTDFGPTEQVTSTKLDNLVDAAKFTNTSEVAVDYSGSTGTCLQGGGLEVTSAGQLQVSDSGINTVKLANSSSKTTGVTFSKMQHISTSKILGRTTAGEGDVEEVSLLDEDTMSSDSDTAVATQQSIKTYVDSQDIGVGQTWQSVSRALDSTEYTNDTGKPIMVNGVFSGATDDHEVRISIKPIGGSYVEFGFAHSTNTGGNVGSNGSTIVPVNSVYKFRATGDTITASTFFELR